MFHHRLAWNLLTREIKTGWHRLNAMLCSVHMAQTGPDGNTLHQRYEALWRADRAVANTCFTYMALGSG